VEREDVFRVKADGLVVVLQRAVVILLLAPGQPAVDKRGTGFRVKPDGFVEVLDCAIVILPVTPGTATILERYGILRVQPDCLVVIPDRNVVVAFFGPSYAALGVSTRIVLIPRNPIGEINRWRSLGERHRSCRSSPQDCRSAL